MSEEIISEPVKKIEPVVDKQTILYNAQEMKKVLQTSELALWLDDYDDLFSDFDPRPYSQRALSDDFLLEMIKAVKNRGNNTFELKFLLSEKLRNRTKEQVIIKRLREHFTRHYHILIKNQKTIIRKGILLVLVGVLVMLTGGFIRTFFLDTHVMFNFIIILVEPAGWFLFWEGLNKTIYDNNKIKPNLDFYHKMSKSKIKFISY